MKTPQLVELQGDQAADSTFPVNSIVYICEDRNKNEGKLPVNILCKGTVSKVFLQLGRPGCLELLYQVDLSGNAYVAETADLFRESSLRFRNGCPVYFTMESDVYQEGSRLQGVILGSCDNPRDNSFFYSIQIQGAHCGRIVHEVRPSQVVYRHCEEYEESHIREDQKRKLIKEEQESSREEVSDSSSIAENLNNEKPREQAPLTIVKMELDCAKELAGSEDSPAQVSPARNGTIERKPDEIVPRDNSDSTVVSHSPPRCPRNDEPDDRDYLPDEMPSTATENDEQPVSLSGNNKKTVEKKQPIYVFGTNKKSGENQQNISVSGKNEKTVEKQQHIYGFGTTKKSNEKQQIISASENNKKSVEKQQNIPASGTKRKSVEKDQQIVSGTKKISKRVKREIALIQVGTHLSIKWPDDGLYYIAQVINKHDCDPSGGKCLFDVIYEVDQVTETIDLIENDFKIIGFDAILDKEDLQKQSKKIDGYVSFSEKTKLVREIEFKNRVHLSSANGTMWADHKILFGEECDENCPCISRLSELTKNVVTRYVANKRKKNPLWKAPIEIWRSTGFADFFCPKFYNLVKSVVPNETPQNILSILIELWYGEHQKNPMYNGVCTKECPCLKKWEDFFSPACKRICTDQKKKERNDLVEMTTCSDSSDASITNDVGGNQMSPSTVTKHWSTESSGKPDTKECDGTNDENQVMQPSKALAKKNSSSEKDTHDISDDHPTQEDCQQQRSLPQNATIEAPTRNSSYMQRMRSESSTDKTFPLIMEPPKTEALKVPKKNKSSKNNERPIGKYVGHPTREDRQEQTNLPRNTSALVPTRNSPDKQRMRSKSSPKRTPPMNVGSPKSASQRNLRAKVKELAFHSIITIPVKSTFIGLIIGIKGCNHKELQRETRCIVSISEVDSRSINVKVQGDYADRVENGTYHVRDMVFKYLGPHVENMQWVMKNTSIGFYDRQNCDDSSGCQTGGNDYEGAGNDCQGLEVAGYYGPVKGENIEERKFLHIELPGVNYKDLLPVVVGLNKSQQRWLLDFTGASSINPYLDKSNQTQCIKVAHRSMPDARQSCIQILQHIEHHLGIRLPHARILQK